MIICPNPDCKAQNEDGVLYCNQCGADLSQVAAQAEAAQLPEIAQPVVTPPPTLPAGIVEPAQVQPEPVPTAAQGRTAKLRVLRGGKPGEEFPILFEGLHVIGRMDPEGKPVEIDLTDQEASLPSSSVSRQHAAIKFENGQYTIEDIGSANGTYVNRGNRLQIGVPQALNGGDEIIVGRVYLKFIRNT